MIQQPLPFDGRRASVQRHSIFFAILPDRVAAASIGELQRDLRDNFGLTSPTIPSERLHVSVFGFGAFLARPDMLIERAAHAAASVRLAPFDIVLDQVCSFGRASNAPLVLSGEGVAGVVALAQELAAAVTQGRRAPPAAFVPHLTLLYDAQRAPKTPISPIRWRVSDFVLIDSLRGKGRYDLLGRWRLCSDQVKLNPTGCAFPPIGAET
jgi:RNA 2',3'-cyclic 3'-phosphodiesterase